MRSIYPKIDQDQSVEASFFRSSKRNQTDLKQIPKRRVVFDKKLN